MQSQVTRFVLWVGSCVCVAALAACSGGTGIPGEGDGINAATPPAAGVDTPTTPPLDTPPDPGLPRPPTAGLPPAVQLPADTTPPPPVTPPPITPPPVTPPPVTPPVAFCSTAVDAALDSGDPGGLTDAPAIAKCAADFAAKLSADQADLTNKLYQGVSSEFKPGNFSQFIIPASSELAQPFVVGDQGYLLAAISTTGKGRGAAYGVNVLEQLANGSNLAHAPAFRRLVGWLWAGDPAKALPATLDVRYFGLGEAAVKDGLSKAGIAATVASCDPMGATGCAEQAQLLVLGSGLADDPAVETRIAQLLAAGKPVLHVHTATWANSEPGRKVLAAMGMMQGGYGGNFWANDAVAPGRTAAANATALSQLRLVAPLLRTMASNNWSASYDWSKCSGNSCDAVPGLSADVLTPSALLRGQIDEFNRANRPLFKQPGTTLLRLLALWGDAARLSIRYPMDKATQTRDFLKATVADGLIAYVRPRGGAQPDLGTFMGAAAAQLPISGGDEVVSVTLPDAGGFTAIGRFAVPGKTLEVQVLDAAGATLSLSFNTLRGGSTRLWDYRYDRPRFLWSPAIALNATATTQMTSPYGGTLQLSYSGAKAGAVVKLRLRGVASQPFLDLRGAATSTAAFASAIQSTTFDWAEIKLPGIEIHTRIDKMRQALKDGGYGDDLDRYIKELRVYFFEDAYQLAGFPVQGKTLPAGVLAYCKQEGWDCTSESIHRPPGLQHINVDIYANCGSGCSGNPYDQDWGLGPRWWGESHELGHNLQQGMLNVYDGKSGEVSNNMFPTHKLERLAREVGTTDGAPGGVKSAFDMIVAGKAEADASKGAYQRIWGSDEYAAQNGERVAFYMQWTYYWGERTGDTTRGWELFTQLYLHQRLFAASSDWAADKNRLGYSQYATRPSVNGNDNLLIALSWMTKRDQRATFNLWGVTFSPAAAAQVESYGFAKEVPLFYALGYTNPVTARDKAVRVDMSVASPKWPSSF